MPEVETPEKLKHVNIHGAEWSASSISRESAIAPVRKSADGPAKWHKGWRVVGVSIPAIAAAKEKREKDIRIATEHNAGILSGVVKGERMQVPAPWDEAKWIASAPLKPVRPKPYEIQEAAIDCAVLARRAGWLRVTVEELKKG